MGFFVVEATRTCVWLKLDVCRMLVRFATQQRDTSGLVNLRLNILPREQRFHNFRS